MSVKNYIPVYDKESPYAITPIFNDFMTYYIHRPIPPKDDDILIKMDNKRYVERPDLLSQDLYNTPDLWWVFGVRNGWEDPVYDCQYMIELYIPSEQTIREAI